LNEILRGICRLKYIVHSIEALRHYAMQTAPLRSFAGEIFRHPYASDRFDQVSQSSIAIVVGLGFELAAR
jgi:hypothetical protein